MTVQILQRTWIPQKSSKLLPHKGYRYDEGTWFAEIHSQSWKSYTLLKREQQNTQIIEYLLEDEISRLPHTCIWIEEYMYDVIQTSEAQPCEWITQDWCIQQKVLPELPSSLLSSLPHLSSPPLAVLPSSPVAHLQQEQQHLSRQPQQTPPLKVSRVARRQQPKSGPSPSLEHTKPKERVKRSNKSSEPSANQSSSNQASRARQKRQGSNKQATHPQQPGVIAAPLPIQQWTPLQTLLQGPLPLKQQVFVSEAPKEKKQHLSQPRVRHPKQSKKKMTTHVES